MPGGGGAGFLDLNELQESPSLSLQLSPLPAGPVAGQFSAVGVFANLLFKDGELSFQRKSR